MSSRKALFAPGLTLATERVMGEEPLSGILIEIVRFRRWK